MIDKQSIADAYATLLADPDVGFEDAQAAFYQGVRRYPRDMTDLVEAYEILKNDRYPFQLGGFPVYEHYEEHADTKKTPIRRRAELISYALRDPDGLAAYQKIDDVLETHLSLLETKPLNVRYFKASAGIAAIGLIGSSSNDPESMATLLFNIAGYAGLAGTAGFGIAANGNSRKRNHLEGEFQALENSIFEIGKGVKAESRGTIAVFPTTALG